MSSADSKFFDCLVEELAPETLDLKTRTCLEGSIHTPEEGAIFGKCIKAMNHGRIPFTSILAKSNLQKLVDISSEQRQVLAEILTTLSESLHRPKLLDKESFAHALKESEFMTENATHLPLMLRYMKELGLTLKGRGASLASLTIEKRIALNDVLEHLVYEKVKLDEKSFDHLLSHVMRVEETHGRELALCIRALQKIDMVLSPLLHRANKLDALLPLSATLLTQITVLLTQLLNFKHSTTIQHLDPIIFDAPNFAEKSDALVICLTAMKQAKINLSRELDIMTCQTLTIFQAMPKPLLEETAHILKALSHVHALEHDVFTEIIEHAARFEGKSKAIVEAIDAIPEDISLKGLQMSLMNATLECIKGLPAKIHASSEITKEALRTFLENNADSRVLSPESAIEFKPYAM